MSDDPLACPSGKHVWTDDEDRRRCCNPAYRRVQALSRGDLEDLGAEHIVFRQIWRGWVRCQERSPSGDAPSP